MPSEQNVNNSESPELSTELGRDIERQVITGIIINILAWPLLFFCAIYVSYKFNTSWVPHPFIDEIFHLNQTVKYIGGHWGTWDPKITTPPGLYVIGWLEYHVMRWVTSWNILSILRFANLVGGMVIWSWVVLRPLYLFNAIGFWPITLISFPLMVNYYFLYYTDVWSTIFIVESMTLALTLPFGEKLSIRASALCGLISCFFRQTNIVWNGFVMLLVLERRALIQKDFNNFHINNYLKLMLHGIENFSSLVLPYAINFLLFIAFLVYNKSLALGDKSSHVAGFHLVQMFYCFMFITFFSLPIWLSGNFLRRYIIRFLQRPLIVIFETLGIMLAIRMFTVLHPFILADNRHFTFYLMRKLIGRNRFFKYVVMAPIYHFSTFVYLEVLRPSTLYFHPILPVKIRNPADLPLQLSHITWTALIICTFVTIVPSPLFEPRYYILPYLFWRVFVEVSPEPFFNEPSQERIVVGNPRRLAFEFWWFMLINTITISIFARYPFPWNTEPHLQRIIW
ncbi:dolichyl-P-Glc:Glc(2)Man(9)GlcNAc(2)-PP-dolichol alpha-1,2- glucosyltransferase Ecym_2078 [Eremothecium cymbalariae DBVPG|uniref:Dol-P-Glc:Glc(2)Man(9)GlcNAc(2)-PP-Dol alpha-1,2-glucosyltransferase n=1 Tax=Eremothecium cymbalariae (strain CBS 270.75 / DBVPG 7215 / KCTC 17166 / NRRL Y-17582) TaxID=931890 RepID=G8JPI5_ERECY|nr:Hypothetical protein Ecym_2078 [Eremothecium cymbalariae DBVPG\